MNDARRFRDLFEPLSDNYIRPALRPYQCAMLARLGGAPIAVVRRHPAPPAPTVGGYPATLVESDEFREIPREVINVWAARVHRNVELRFTVDMAKAGSDYTGFAVGSVRLDAPRCRPAPANPSPASSGFTFAEAVEIADRIAEHNARERRAAIDRMRAWIEDVESVMQGQRDGIVDEAVSVTPDQSRSLYLSEFTPNTNAKFWTIRPIEPSRITTEIRTLHRDELYNYVAMPWSDRIGLRFPTRTALALHRSISSRKPGSFATRPRG